MKADILSRKDQVDTQDDNKDIQNAKGGVMKECQIQFTLEIKVHEVGSEICGLVE